MEEMIRNILQARTIVLSTHRHADGDGLGAQMALLRGLRLLGKSVRALNVDAPDSRYHFLGTSAIEVFGADTKFPEPVDLTLVLDTNDGRLLEPLFSHLKSQSRQVLFIDHHALLSQGPQPSDGSWIDLEAASTGELCYLLLKKLLPDGEVDSEIARALYTSVVFDTQLFKFIRSSPRSHLMAAELLRYEKNPEEVHRALFATYSIEKLNFLTSGLAKVDYLQNGKIAYVMIEREDLKHVSPDTTGDIVDMVMNVTSVEVAALLREESAGKYKLSLRSKGRLSVLPLAERFGGGGHKFAAGAYISGSPLEPRELKNQIIDELKIQLKAVLK